MRRTQRPLAPPRPPLEISEPGDARAAWLSVLTTEHYNLAMLRIATISESTGRASVFLGAVSAGLIALGFRGAGDVRASGTLVFDIVVLTSLVFLGFVAFLRCLEISIDDWEFGVRLGVVREVYTRLMPDLAPLLSMTAGDEQTLMMLRGRWYALQKMLSIAGSVAVLASVVLGADAGVIAYGARLPLAAAICIGVAVGLAAGLAAVSYQHHRWCEATPPPVPNRFTAARGDNGAP